ncbi:MAG: hypothetical protein CMI54_02380 [Parcubacteria group bacterium]|nr:hypothetical protein [Parcubacteria group bacterium]|tara:strand:+ start:24199 stop:24588 length:390 start_codon:yes stop_codon:yes gene_type:complete
MAVEGKYETWAMEAAEDMDTLNAGTGHLHKAVDAARTIAATGDEAIGILKHAGKNTEHITVGVSGIMKYVASAAIVAGARISATTSGYFVTATSGTYVNGQNLDVAVASGAVGTGLFHFGVSNYLTDSN